jgi:RNA recognition motif-containing protein
MQTTDPLQSASSFGHRHTQSFAPKATNLSNDSTSFSGAFHSAQPSIGGYADRHPQQRSNVQPINTGRMQSNSYSAQDMQTPQTGYDMNFTPLLPSQLLMGSPFQPGSPSTFQSPQFQSFSNFPQQSTGRHNSHGQMSNAFHQQQSAMSPGAYQTMTSPTALGASSYFGGIQSPTTGFNALAGANLGGYGPAMQLAPGLVSGTSRTVYLGNIPPDTSAEEILGHVRSGQIESVRLLPDKNCAFISFLDGSSATHFHSDAILKKLSIKGQDIKVGWGKPSSVPTSVALAVQQSGASRNVYLGNLPEETTEEELREDLSKFGPIDTVKIVREKAIGFVHFLSIGNAIKAVTQMPQEPKWQAPRRVYYGKDRCAYVSKTQQQNAAQYLGIAPGYAHVLNGADRDLITNALAQQSVAAAAVATTAGGVNNLGNRTVYLGNIHPETTIEEICNVVRGGLLHHIRYIPDKHICFVTFIDPTSAASFYALSNLQGLMIHNRRLKIGWGKHSGALPPAIALAVSGGASRNVYIGNLDETWSEDRLRQDFQEYGEIELVNTLREKSCAFVNFTNIANAIKAIEAVRQKEEYKRFKVNFGKDRCGNPPRQVMNQQHMQPQHQQSQENGVGSPSPVNGLQQSRAHNSISPASSGAQTNGAFNPLSGPTASTIFNTGSNNPLTMYLAATQQNAQAAAEQAQQAAVQHQQQQRQHEDLSPNAFAAGLTPQQSYGLQPNTQPSSATTQMTSQQAFYSSPNEVTSTRSAGFEPPSAQPFGHGSHHSMNLSNGVGMQGLNSYSNSAVSQAQRSQHSRAVSLPAFSLQAAQQAQLQAQQQQQNNSAGGFNGLSGLGGFVSSAGGYGLGVSSNEGALPGWAEEEVA